MIWQISLVLVAIAFGVLVYYLVQTLKSLRGSLDEIRHTMGAMKGELTQVSSEVKDVLHNTNQMAVDVRTKLQDLEPLFRSANDVGTMLHELTATVKDSAASLSSVIQNGRRRAMTTAPGKVQKVMSGIPVAIDLWHSFRQHKERRTAAWK